jgi:hypothetical protein
VCESALAGNKIISASGAAHARPRAPFSMHLLYF